MSIWNASVQDLSSHFIGNLKAILSDSHKNNIYPTCFPRILVSQATFRCQTDSSMRRVRTTSIICEYCFVSQKLCVFFFFFPQSVLLNKAPELLCVFVGWDLNMCSLLSTHVASSWQWRCLITWNVSWTFSWAVSLKWNTGVWKIPLNCQSSWLCHQAAVFYIVSRQTNADSALNRERMKSLFQDCFLKPVFLP